MLSSVRGPSIAYGSWRHPERACAHNHGVLEANEVSPALRHWRNSSALPPFRGTDPPWNPFILPQCAAAANSPLLNPPNP